eukprot:6473350-Amphidinium_carterae.1
MGLSKRLRKKPSRRLRPRLSLRYVGLQPATQRKYDNALRYFFRWLSWHSLPLPSSFARLDELAAEFIDHLYLDDRPHAYAACFLCGLRRYVPSARRRTETAGLFFKNWSRVLQPRRAFPLPKVVLLGMAGAALLLYDHSLATLLLTGFVGLFRT